MNLFDLTFMAMGGIIGAGIFSSVGEGIGVTGRSITLALIVGMVFQMSQQARYVFTSSMVQGIGRYVLTGCAGPDPLSHRRCRSDALHQRSELGGYTASPSPAT